MRRGAGYDVVHFSESRGAAEWLGRHKADLVISDMRLPDISGVSFCRLVRAAAERSTIPVLMLSAVREEGDKVEKLLKELPEVAQVTMKGRSGTELSWTVRFRESIYPPGIKRIFSSVTIPTP